MNDFCPICSSAMTRPKTPDGSLDAFEYHCAVCGVFRLSGTLEAALPKLLLSDLEASTKLSFFFRTYSSAGKPLQLNTHTAIEILKRPLPRPREQADILIRWYAKSVPGPGETVSINGKTDRSLIGAKSDRGLEMVLEHLKARGLIEGIGTNTLHDVGNGEYTLTFDGWEYFETLKSGAKSYKKAFMAMKFGNATLNNMLETVFKPAAKETGFVLSKLDDNPKAGLIDDQMRVEIQTSDFVLADLTHDNLGAYWEAGYAEGLGKPVIYACERSKFSETKTHFDTNHHLTIVWDADDTESARNRLKATIRATFPLLAIQGSEDV